MIAIVKNYEGLARVVLTWCEIHIKRVGTVLFCIVFLGLVRYGIVFYSMVLYSTVWYCILQYGMAMAMVVLRCETD